MIACRANSGASLGFEKTLCHAADKMSGHIDMSEHEHIALDLIILKVGVRPFLDELVDCISESEQLVSVRDSILVPLLSGSLTVLERGS